MNEPMADEEFQVNSLFGVASAGAALDGLVTLRATSSSGTEISTSVNNEGYYEFSDSALNQLGGVAPYVLKINGTVGGRNLTLYSIGRNRGRLNINPITDLALSMSSLNNLREGVFRDTSLIPSQSSYEDSVNQIKSLLSIVLTNLSVTDVNPVNDELKSDGSGFDALFDLVKFESSYDATGAVTSITFRDYKNDDLGHSSIDSLSSMIINSNSLNNLQSVPENLDRIRNLLESFRISLNSNSVTTTALSTLVHSNFDSVHSGRNRTQFLEHIIDYNPARNSNVNQSLAAIKNLVILEVVDPVENIFKIDFKYVFSGGGIRSPQDPFYVQLLNNEWKFTSNKYNSDISNIFALTRAYKDTDGVQKVFTGFNFEIWDENELFSNALIKGSGLPEEGILLDKSSGISKKLVLAQNHRNTELPMDQYSFYTMSDEQIESLELNENFTISLRNSTNTTIETRYWNLHSKPMLLSNWNPDHFPKLSNYGDQSINAAKQTNTLFTYSSVLTEPQTMFIPSAYIVSNDKYGSNQEIWESKELVLLEPYNQSLSTSIPASMVSTIQYAALELSAIDGTGRRLSNKVLFGGTELRCQLTGNQQRPHSVTTTDKGTATITISPDWGSLEVSLMIENMTSASGMFIHYGEVGTTGPIIFNLGSFANQKTLTLTSQNLITSPANSINDLTDALEAIIQGKAYININTVENPTGHIRGQIGAVSLKAHLDGKNQIQIVNTNSKGTLNIQLNGKQDKLYLYMDIEGISNIDAIVISRGLVGENLGDILSVNSAQNGLSFPLSRELDQSNFIQNIQSGVETYDQAIAYLMSGETYINVITPIYHQGELRGQIGPFRMHAVLRPEDVVPFAIAAGSASGTMSLDFNGIQNQITTKLNGVSLVSIPTSANIKIGSTIQNGNILFNLSNGSNQTSLQSFSIFDSSNIGTDAISAGILTFSDVVRIIESQMTYVEINTVNHPRGVVRGQIKP